MKHLGRFLLTVLLITIISSPSFAQYKAIFQEGIALLKQGKCSEAINKFELASQINPKKKNECDKKINESRICLYDNIYNEGKYLYRKGRCKEAKRKFEEAKRILPRKASECNIMIEKCKDCSKDPDPLPDFIELSDRQLIFNGNTSSTKMLYVKSKPKELEFSLEDEKAKKWCIIEKVDNNDGQQWLKVTCSPSKKSTSRSTRVKISVGDMTEYVDIIQNEGTFAELYIDSYQKGNKITMLSRSRQKNAVIVVSKKKGLDQVIVNIECHSDEVYKDNNNYNWMVESMPEWCTRKETKNIYKSIKHKIFSFFDKKHKTYTTVPANSTELVFEVSPISNYIELKKGRIENIVLRSQNQRCEITISQTK